LLQSSKFANAAGMSRNTEYAIHFVYSSSHFLRSNICIQQNN